MGLLLVNLIMLIDDASEPGFIDFAEECFVVDFRDLLGLVLDLLIGFIEKMLEFEYFEVSDFSFVSDSDVVQVEYFGFIRFDSFKDQRDLNVFMISNNRKTVQKPAFHFSKSKNVFLELGGFELDIFCVCMSHGV